MSNLPWRMPDGTIFWANSKEQAQYYSGQKDVHLHMRKELTRCNYCNGITAVKVPDENRNMTCWEWCQHFNQCAAGIDWDEVYGH